jgi:hypothetical protein
MRKLPLTAIAASLALTLPLLAQSTRVSPHETVSARVGPARSLVEVVYGRPYSKDPKSGEKRKIWGTLVEFGKPWRMGSDEATLFLSPIDLTVGETTIPAGSYSLIMQPESDGSAKLFFNKQTARWGIPITPAVTKDNLYTVDMKKADLEKEADQFTITLKGAADSLTLSAQWESTQYTVTFTPKK